jgi:N-acetylmannosamine-6-phosphate 2-epimerase/N-acetylmannosamine kinase
MEDAAGGRAIAAAARAAGHELDAAGVFRAAGQGSAWAGALLDESARRVAQLAANIQMTLDPGLIVIGGGVGLGIGYLDRLRHALADVDQPFRPDIRPAMLGARAGIIGVADLAAGGGRIQGREDQCGGHVSR